LIGKGGPIYEDGFSIVENCQTKVKMSPS